jgi:hypothetical protein
MYTAVVTWKQRKSPGGPILASGTGAPMCLDRRDTLDLLEAFDYASGRQLGVAHMYPTPCKDCFWWEATLTLEGPDLAALFECTDHLCRYERRSGFDPVTTQDSLVSCQSLLP